MSRVIKPGDKALFDSVRKFEKKSLLLTPKPKPANVKEAVAALDPLSVTRDNPDQELVAQQADPHELTAEAGRKAEKMLMEAECKAEQTLRETLIKAEQMLREAESKVNQIREQARQEGRSEGCALAAEEARLKTDEHLRASSQLLDSLVNHIKTHQSEFERRVTPMIANLAAELAQKIIYREIEKDSSTIVTRAAEEAIGKILERERIIIRVNPADEELMKLHKEPLMKMFDGVDKIEVIADPSIERGGCTVETNLIRVEAQPNSQLEAARKVLLTEAAK